MPTILPIADIIELGRVTTYLSANYVRRGKLFGARLIEPNLPVQIAFVTDALSFGNESGAVTDASLRDVANYAYWLFGKFQLEAQEIIGNEGGGSVVPTPAISTLPNPYDWVVEATTSATAPLKNGDTTVTLDGTNGTQDYRGYNLEFTRNNMTQNTSVPLDGVSTYYSWNRITGVFTLNNGAAATGEQMRILPTR